MRKTLLCGFVVLVPHVLFSQDLGAAAGTGRQAAGVIGGLSGPLSSASGASRMRSEEMVYRDEPATTRPPVRKSRSSRRPAASSLPAITPVARLALQAPPKPAPGFVTEQSLAKVTEGQSRSDLLAALGYPVSVSSVQGLQEGGRETFVYRLSGTRGVYVRLLNGFVASVMTD
jgi:hypothetical protein